jgi:hypothetical protein
VKLEQHWAGPMALLLVPHAGSMIDWCVDEAIGLAKLIRAPVAFVFNDVFLLARPDSAAKELLDSYRKRKPSDVPLDWGKKS